MPKLNKAPQFDPNKNYRWEPADTFDISLTGSQFASLYHCLQQEANNPGGAPVLLKYEAYMVVMDILKGAVADGTVEEVTVSNDVNVAKIEDNVKSIFK